MLASALEHYVRQQRISAAGVLAARKVSKKPLEAAKVVTAFQILAIRDAVTSLGRMLDEQGMDAPAEGLVAPAALAGIASDGRPLDTLLAQAQTGYQFGLMVATQLQDAARTASGLSIASRPQVSGYVRMMNPPSCSRCAVLAGKWFKWNQGFRRHPRCDCRHIPAQEADYSDPRLSGDKWFHTLPTADELNAKYPNLSVKMRNEAGIYSQEDIFTRAGAQAIRDGADMNQVVNARRGMQRAQLYGHDAFITLEGTTSRAMAFDALARRGGTYRSPEELATRITATGPELRRINRERVRSPRVMPETIYQIAADDRAEAIRLLKAHGFLT